MRPNQLCSILTSSAGLSILQNAFAATATPPAAAATAAAEAESLPAALQSQACLADDLRCGAYHAAPPGTQLGESWLASTQDCRNTSGLNIVGQVLQGGLLWSFCTA